MRLDFFELKCQTSTIILSLCIKYFMSDLNCFVWRLRRPKNCDVGQIMTSALDPLLSVRPLIPFLRHWDGNYVVSVFHIFSFFSFPLQYYHLDLFCPYPHLKHSNWWRQVRSRIKYLISTYNILVLLVHSNLTEYRASLAGFNTKRCSKKISHYHKSSLNRIKTCH